MKKLFSLKNKYKYFIVIIFLFFIFREEPLSKKIYTNNIESNVEASVIRHYDVKENDRITYKRKKTYELNDSINSEAIQELLSTLESIPSRYRLFLPFETITIYASGIDSLYIEYVSDGERIQLAMLSSFSTLYKYNGDNVRAYQIGIESFEKIASVIEKYGIVIEK